MTGHASTAQSRADAWNSYRETLNPLRGLTISRAVQLVESYPRGEFADLMWTFGAPFVGIECADADLSTIIGRRCDALLEMDWNAKMGIRGEDDSAVDRKLAEEQQAWLKECVGGIGNLYEAIEHLAIAFHRGFAHLEIIDGPEGIDELRPVDQWNVVRDGSRGGWRYNPKATQTTYASLPEANEMDPKFFVIREVRRPVGRISLVKFIRQNLTEKDWSAFLELYGTLTGVVIMPPDVPVEQEALYQSAAEKVATGGAGALPHGADYKPNPATQGRGTEIFENHLRYLTEKLIQVGTSGLLTVLTESGSGTLAGGAHADAFQQLARAEARRVSEILQEQVFAPRLAAAFPGRPVSAYFELAFREEVDAAKVVEDAVKLASAGYVMDAGELSEKTGYKLSLASKSAEMPIEGDEPDANGPNSQNAQGLHRGIAPAEGEDRGNGVRRVTGDSGAISENGDAMRNRASGSVEDRAVASAAETVVTRAAVEPVGDRFAGLVAGDDVEGLRRLVADLPELVDAADLARVIERAAVAGLDEGRQD